MMSTWMLYCALVSGLLGAGALGVERALHAFRRPTRWGWVAAISLSAALPFTTSYVGALRSALLAPPAAVALGEGTAEAVQLASAVPAPPPDSWRQLLAWADVLLLPAWLLASVALLLAGGVLLTAVHLRRRQWRREMVAGIPVLIAPRVGPAVVGFFHSRIVLPEWVLAWDESRRRLVVEHEREHVRARDPLLLLMGLAAVVLVPWNPALWWQLRRLRLAIEVDCDTRVLRGQTDVRSYGMLLLEVGRLASSGRLPVAALSEPRSFLERRIRMMTSPKSTRRLHVAALAAVLCLAAAATAVALPTPAVPIVEVGITAQPPVVAGGDTIIDVSRADEKPRLVNAAEVARLLRESYPPLLRDAGVTGSATVAFVLGEDGAVTEARTLESTHPAFSDVAVTVVRQARFRPARLRGQPVRVRVTLPVTFDLPGGAAATPLGRVEAQDGVVDVSRLTTRPRLTNAREVTEALQAAYPPLLRAAGITGTAMVRFVVDEQGMVVAPDVVRASRPEFGEAARSVASKLRFSPGELDGRPTAARVTMPITFDLPVPPR